MPNKFAITPEICLYKALSTNKAYGIDDAYWHVEGEIYMSSYRLGDDIIGFNVMQKEYWKNEEMIDEAFEHKEYPGMKFFQFLEDSFEKIGDAQTTLVDFQKEVII